MLKAVLDQQWQGIPEYSQVIVQQCTYTVSCVLGVLWVEEEISQKVNGQA